MAFSARAHKYTDATRPVGGSKGGHPCQSDVTKPLYWPFARCLAMPAPIVKRTDPHMKRFLTVFMAAAFVSTAAIAQTAPEAIVKSAVQGTVEAMKADPQARGGDMSKITGVVESHFVP